MGGKMTDDQIVEIIGRIKIVKESISYKKDVSGVFKKIIAKETEQAFPGTVKNFAINLIIDGLLNIMPTSIKIDEITIFLNMVFPEKT